MPQTLVEISPLVLNICLYSQYLETPNDQND